MQEQDRELLDNLKERKTLDDLSSSMKQSKKKVRARLDTLVGEGLIDSDGAYYLAKEGVKGTARKRGLSVKVSYVAIALLLLITLMGFYLRIYHIDYPVVGYHNWKETHYLTEARNFAREGFFKYGIFVPAWDYPFINADPSGAHSDTFPTISIIAALAFMVMGVQLWVARLVGILFTIGSIILMYLIMKKLFNREDIALVSALLTATLPLLVFFSHNVDLINPGLFFMLASAYYYLRWRDSFDGKELVITALFLSLAGLTKYPFLIIAIPMFFTLPYRKLRSELGKQWRYITISAVLILLIPAWLIYSEEIIGNKYGTMAYTLSEGGMVKLEVLTTPEWWTTQQMYMRDNYTMLGLFFAGLGALALIYFFARKSALGESFVFWYLLGAVPFFTIMSYKLGGHSYHQYPVAPLLVMLVAYFAIKSGDYVKTLIKQKDTGALAGGGVSMVLLLLFYFPLQGALISTITPSLCDMGFCESFQDAWSRQFDTQFIGLDVAGGYIKEHSQPSERIIFPSHQSYGVLWHADRKGYTLGGDLENLQKAEIKGADWLFLYQWGLGDVANDKTRWDYVRSHYSLKQVAFIQTDKGGQPIYFLLKRGGSFSDKDLDLAGKDLRYKDYEYTRGMQRMYYVNFD